MYRRVMILALAAALMAAAVPAGAEGNERISRGDVVAHFNAGYSAGSFILGRGGPAAENSAPAGWFRGGIRPFIGSPWEFSTHCEDDWHVLLTGIGNGPPFAFTRQDALPFLDTIDVRLFLDEQQLETVRSSVKPSIGELHWWHHTGTFFGPGELEPGDHELRAEYRSPFFPPDAVFTDGPITFTVDASGTGVCN